MILLLNYDKFQRRNFFVIYNLDKIEKFLASKQGEIFLYKF